jgi:phosphoglycerate dehydrogenase-like enzyme
MRRAAKLRVIPRRRSWQACKDVDGHLVFGTSITRSVIELLERCQVIGRCRGGRYSVSSYAPQPEDVSH